jgi:cell division protein FtsB
MTAEGLPSAKYHLSPFFYSFRAVYFLPLSFWLLMKFTQLIPPFLRNKYLVSLSLFAIWMLFFDKNDFFTQLQRKKDLYEIEESKSYFAQKIDDSKKFSRDMQNNAAAIEKFAREKYHMKRENEDLFLVRAAGSK